MPGVGDLHDGLRPLMFAVAYRMTGSVTEAEDVVQEAFLRMHVAERAGTAADNAEAFATTVTTRVAIDALRRARRRKETYVGAWLPEPLVDVRRSDQDSVANDPAGLAERSETLSVAVLVLLEELGPVERAVFVLREALGYDYRHIASVVATSEANCRQICSRARRRIASARPAADTPRAPGSHVGDALVDALRRADVAGIEHLLSREVVLVADGGGQAPVVSRPVVGATAVARFLSGLMRRGARVGAQLSAVTANGGPAVLVRGPDDGVVAVLSLDVADGQIVALFNQVNPDKLRHLGPVGDLNALLGR